MLHRNYCSSSRQEGGVNNSNCSGTNYPKMDKKTLKIYRNKHIFVISDATKRITHSS